MAQATVREMGRRRDPVPPRSITDRPLHILIASPLEEEHAIRIANANLGRIRVYFELDPLPVPRHVANYSGIARSLNEVERIRWLCLLSK
jgi:hypothetical protein